MQASTSRWLRTNAPWVLIAYGMVVILLAAVWRNDFTHGAAVSMVGLLPAGLWLCTLGRKPLMRGSLVAGTWLICLLVVVAIERL